MTTRSTIVCALALALLASPARAQDTMSPDLRIERASAALETSRSTPALALGGLVGGAAGLVGGFYLGAVLADEEGDDFAALAGGVAGAAIGQALLVPLGVHLANGRRGSYPRAALASLGIAAAGVVALAGVGFNPPGGPVVLVAVPVAEIAASISIARSTD